MSRSSASTIWSTAAVSSSPATKEVQLRELSASGSTAGSMASKTTGMIRLWASSAIWSSWAHSVELAEAALRTKISALAERTPPAIRSRHSAAASIDVRSTHTVLLRDSSAAANRSTNSVCPGRRAYEMKASMPRRSGASTVGRSGDGVVVLRSTATTPCYASDLLGVPATPTTRAPRRRDPTPGPSELHCFGVAWSQYSALPGMPCD